MFSVRCASIALALAVAGAGHAAQAGVVVSATGPSAAQYPAGKKLDDNSRIVLKDGDRVTVLTANGTRVISGAGTHQVGAAGASKRSTFAVLTRQRSGQRVRTGAVRGGPAEPSGRNPNLWYVDVSQAGTVCVADPAAIRLWRPAAQGATTLVLARPGSADHIHVSFADGEADTAWDRDRMPLAEGATYTISGPDGTQRVVRYTMLGAAPDDPEALASQLIEKGCSAQLALLTAAMS
jgi:hypothetical protein